MKVLIVGLGSVGQRHVRILRKIFKNNISLFVLNSSRNNIVIKDNFKTLKVNSLSDYYNLKKWEIFEQGQPNTFTAMYQFWCQAND